MIEWTDRFILLHGLSLWWLAAVIWRSGWLKERFGMIAKWPPAILTVWGTVEFLDGATDVRRYIDRTWETDFFEYGGMFSFWVNLASIVAVTALGILIVRGGSEQE